MRLLVLLTLPLLGSTVGLADEPIAVKAWFTEARIKDSVDSPRPAEALPASPGTAGEGVELREATAIENPLLRQASGYICFWIQPRWNGDDRAAHQILRIGDPDHNGLLVEKAASGMLRFVMASLAEVTAARADVSHWRAGEWHHVAVAWFSKDDRPIGLPLWIDRVAVAGPVAGGNMFLDPEAMSDQRVWIGDASSDAVMDELIFRQRLNAEGPEGQKAIVYRDYFRTAPYTEIKITPEALRVPSDRRVVAGHEKQFGLLAQRGGEFEYVTDYAVRYGQWGYFDANGNLNALRYKHWKLHFALMEGDLPTAYRKSPAWPKIVNLRQDPYERFLFESQMYLRWYADKMWTMVPAQAIVREHLESFKEFPPTRGSSLSVDKVLQQMQTQQARQ